MVKEALQQLENKTILVYVNVEDYEECLPCTGTGRCEESGGDCQEAGVRGVKIFDEMQKGT